MEMLTKELILKICEDRVKGQKPVLLFLCCLPICIFAGFVMRSFIAMLLITIILGVVIIVRQNMVKKDYSNIKKDNFQVYFDVVNELPYTRTGRRNGSGGTRTCYIVTKNLYKNRHEVLPTIYDALKVDDGIIVIVADGKLIGAFALRSYQIGIDIENKIKNYDEYKQFYTQNSYI